MGTKAASAVTPMRRTTAPDIAIGSAGPMPNTTDFASNAPEVLLNGNHEQIRRFRKELAIAKTARLRKGLLKETPESGE